MINFKYQAYTNWNSVEITECADGDVNFKVHNIVFRVRKNDLQEFCNRILGVNPASRFAEVANKKERE